MNRIETGKLLIDYDCLGLFIRGDDCLDHYITLKWILTIIEKYDIDDSVEQFYRTKLENILELYREIVDYDVEDE